MAQNLHAKTKYLERKVDALQTVCNNQKNEIKELTRKMEVLWNLKTVKEERRREKEEKEARETRKKIDEKERLVVRELKLLDELKKKANVNE